jgi:hypothetical protein
VGSQIRSPRIPPRRHIGEIEVDERNGEIALRAIRSTAERPSKRA